ncbi:hypothetical protein [Actinomadura gamaensis]|uniref:DUF2716 domain-containing protein n=1 Tax=Actinomadura gamaensis TaxID=1763541 RepID=A0ABV9TQJ0_9ACTN
MGSPEGRVRLIVDAAGVSDASSWVVDGIGEFGSGVRGLMPPVFEGYVRILHPASSPSEEPVRWEDVAREAGTRVDARTRFDELAKGASGRLWDEGPRAGEFPASRLPALASVLRAHTRTPDACWFCLWDGWGWIPDGTFASAPRVRLPHRDYLLYEGPVDAADEFGQRGDGFFFPQSPNLFWPADRGWCVATEIDLESTYVGGSAALAEALLTDDRFEALSVTADDPVA